MRGDRTDRHLGIAWGDVSADGTFRLIRASKVYPGIVWSVDHA